jgi:hypothetical protein
MLLLDGQSEERGGGGSSSLWLAGPCWGGRGRPARCGLVGNACAIPPYEFDALLSTFFGSPVFVSWSHRPAMRQVWVQILELFCAAAFCSPKVLCILQRRAACVAHLIWRAYCECLDWGLECNSAQIAAASGYLQGCYVSMMQTSGVNHGPHKALLKLKS